MRRLLRQFWAWYQRHYLVTLLVTTVAFLLQVFHLYWLLTAVVLEKLTGRSFFVFPQSGMFVYVLADYLEIPALVSASLLYLFELRKRVTVGGLLYVILLNTQWVHLLWITDEVLLAAVAQYSLLAWSAAVAWVAILIDYLEVPVIVDTLYKVYQNRRAIWHRLRARARDSPGAAPGVGPLARPVSIPPGARRRGRQSDRRGDGTAMPAAATRLRSRGSTQ